MAKPWEKVPERQGRSKLRLLFKLLVAYFIYLVFWGCPAETGGPNSASFASRPCASLHSLYTTQLSPLWEEYGQPYYDILEPYSSPIVAKLEPVSAQVKEKLRGHVGSHYDQIKQKLAPHLKPVLPHITAARNLVHKYVSIATPYVERALANLWLRIQEVCAKGSELYFAHVAPKLSEYLRDLDKRQVLLVEQATNWANLKYETALQHAHDWLSEKVANTIKGTPVSESPKNPETTSTPYSTAASTTAAFESTIPAGSTDADDFIENSTPTSATTTATKEAKRINIGSASGPAVGEKPLRSDTPRRASWPDRVVRTIKSAKKNLNIDSKEFQENIITEAKPGIMKKLRELSKYGETNVKELNQVIVEVEADKLEESAEVYDKFDSVAQHIQSLMLAVRGECESLAQTVIDKVAELRKDALESLDDFFDIVLIEAGKEVAEDDGTDSDDGNEWEKWQAYSKLKKQVTEARKTIEDYEPDMETVNVALRESQQAAIILTQEFIQHVKTMRARAQFHLQQKAILRSQEQGDEPVDAEWYVINENEAMESSEEIPDLVHTDSESESDLETDAEPEAQVEHAERAAQAEPVEEDEETLTEFVTEVVYETRFNTHSSI